MKITATVILNGTPYGLETESEAPNKDLIRVLLVKIGHDDSHLGNWELRNANGHVLDPDGKIGGSPLAGPLYLSQKAGVGG